MSLNKLHKRILWMVISANLVLMGLSAPARANETANMDVTAEVVASCTLAANPLNLGNYTLSGISGVSTTITAQCTTGTDYSITADGGQNFANGTRRMLGTTTGDFLEYNIFIDDQGSVVFDTNNPINGIGDSTLQTYTVYGFVPANQAASVDQYNDVAVVNLTIN